LGGVFIAPIGYGHGYGHARVFFPDRQELAVAQTACRSSKTPLARPPCRGKLAETMIKAFSLIGDTLTPKTNFFLDPQS
jgi:hypothetical protein